jgi:nucleoid DNA-binding protein
MNLRWARFPEKSIPEITEILPEVIESALELGADALISGLGRLGGKEKRGRNPASGENAIMTAAAG